MFRDKWKSGQRWAAGCGEIHKWGTRNTQVGGQSLVSSLSLLPSSLSMLPSSLGLFVAELRKRRKERIEVKERVERRKERKENVDEAWAQSNNHGGEVSEAPSRNHCPSLIILQPAASTIAMMITSTTAKKLKKRKYPKRMCKIFRQI